MILKVATAEDLDILFADLRPMDIDTLERLGGLVRAREIVDLLMVNFPHQLFVTEEGKPVALWIALRKWDGCFELFGYTGNEAEKNKVGFYKACMRGCEYIRDILGAHKIECIVWGNYDRSIRWLKRLGFEKEGYCRQHGPDKSDATIMGRVM